MPTWWACSLIPSFNPFRMKTPKYLFQRGNKPLLYHQIGNRNFFILSLQISKNLIFCVDKIKYEHLAILSNLKSCQFSPGIVIFICVYVANSRICRLFRLKIIHYEPSQHLTVTNEGSFFCNFFIFLLVHNSEFLENLIKNYCIRMHFYVV